jgi:hypothetical protein
VKSPDNRSYRATTFRVLHKKAAQTSGGIFGLFEG